MSIKDDAEQLAKVMAALDLNETQQMMVLELILVLRPVLGAYIDVSMIRDGLTREQCEAVIIAALTTQTMAHTVYRKNLLEGKSADDYLKDYLKDPK